MKALFYSEFKGKITIENVPDPEPAARGVVIRVAASGLCLSDWHGWMGHDPDIRLPHVPGHELAGTVVALGREVKKWNYGQRVTVPFVGGCGSCVYCREGNQQVCNHQFQPGFTAWGSFAEYVAIDYADENLVALPEELDFINAASLGCRFVTAYRAIVDQAGMQKGQWLAIHGCGGVGLSAILIAKALGTRVIAIDIAPAKLDYARDLGADYQIDARNGNIPEQVYEISQGGVHVSMDALGHPQTCLNSILSLRKGGKHLQVGLMGGNTGIPAIPMERIIANELQLIGSHGIQAHRYPNLFSLLKQSGIRPAALVGSTVNMEQAAALLPLLNQSQRPGIAVLVP